MKDIKWAESKAEEITSGSGVSLDVPMGTIAEKLRKNAEFTLGAEYGYLQALKDGFGVSSDPKS